jgi:hypothetical protein
MTPLKSHFEQRHCTSRAATWRVMRMLPGQARCPGRHRQRSGSRAFEWAGSIDAAATMLAKKAGRERPAASSSGLTSGSSRKSVMMVLGG